LRLKLEARCNTDDGTVARHIKKNGKKRYAAVQYQVAKLMPPCAIVGGGPSLPLMLDTLRNWGGDIYAVNDTSGYLSENGIANYLYAIDSTNVPYRTGMLTQGAVLATRCHPVQFKPFQHSAIRVFDMVEDSPFGAQGGPTAVCRAPHLFLRMGYTGVVFFGCDGCFSDLKRTHASGTQSVAYENMVIIRAAGVDYFSNASLLMQSEFLIEAMQKFPQFVVNASGGMLKAMLEDPEWYCAAVAGDLKKKYDDLGETSFKVPYTPEGKRIWQQQAAS
jgi:hypothetical protein